MSTSEAGGAPSTQPAFFGRPPRPPKITARAIEDQPDDPNRIIFLPDEVEVRELAAKLGVKPFQIVADLLDMRHFKHADETIDFETASKVAQNYGCQAVRSSEAWT
jgi:translation initiation factor IF-2